MFNASVWAGLEKYHKNLNLENYALWRKVLILFWRDTEESQVTKFKQFWHS